MPPTNSLFNHPLSPPPLLRLAQYVILFIPPPSPLLSSLPLFHQKPPLRPVTGLRSCVEEFSFWRSRGGIIVVAPLRRQRHADEDGFGSSAGFEAEGRTPVVHEVELDVTPTTHLLPFFFLLGELVVHVFANDRSVGGSDVLEALLGEVHDTLRVTVVEVVKEDASEPTHFVAVTNGEIVIAPRLETGVEPGVMSIADRLEGAMKMTNVVLNDVDGGKIRTAAKPPLAGQAMGGFGFEIAVVKVHGGAVGITRVHYRGDTGSEKRNFGLGIKASALKSVCGSSVGINGHFTMNNRDVYTGLLPNISLLKNTTDATTTTLARPDVFTKLSAINIFNSLANIILSIADNFLKPYTSRVVAISSRA
eukprot:CAMPEP_0175050094 /NCGR_PEP_ID=MMETSP0052_2-20121109/7080_1 /TAXON_ID=51329 ORGANISM="Polytomella parva, Strain SAG 63-3" /NCGR_SAMPLE_ID=MMETSP0052_2 /ASSEMBLY_ACC=CAM_ASM_000194 /LENGTH=362 /DNA_ID=CAMNT_0016314283 /DNA_START=651 /DNA_END=1740 /DNA_ORIENTATION=+